jgi:hypothetical protein
MNKGLQDLPVFEEDKEDLSPLFASNRSNLGSLPYSKRK